MAKGLFITATGTDIGKTYITALLAKKLKEAGASIAYYKAALSGADSIAESDAGYVHKIANLEQDPNTLLSYLYKNAVSPHLAAQIEGNPLEKNKVLEDYGKVAAKFENILIEGSGGIICPIRYDDKYHYFLEDIIKWLNVPALIVADAGLGTINAIVLTVNYLRAKNIPVAGIILNNYKGNTMEKDNIFMVEEITGLPVLATVAKGDTDIAIEPEKLLKLFK